MAVHLACRSIWQDGCPLALAGGVNALLLPDWYVGFCRLGMLSPDGRCRAFDAGANGFVRSEGAGMVVLKPLAQALADGDRIYAVIRGTAMNQDGRTPGMTVPSQEAQEALLRQACRDAGVAPGAIQYVEAHGTGTPVGDPIEARALGRVLSDGRPGEQPCLIGSVKTNIGHLEAGAGIAGLIKVGAGAAPSPDSRQPALRAAQPGDRLRRAAPARADALRALARRRRPGPGRRQLVWLRRHQRARRPARGARAACQRLQRSPACGNPRPQAASKLERACLAGPAVGPQSRGAARGGPVVG